MFQYDVPLENPFAPPPTGLSKEKEEKVVIIQQVIQQPQIQQQVPQQNPLPYFLDCLCLAFVARAMCKVFCPCVSSVTLRL